VTLDQYWPGIGQAQERLFFFVFSSIFRFSSLLGCVLLICYLPWRPSLPPGPSSTTASAIASLALGASPIDPALHSSSSQSPHDLARFHPAAERSSDDHQDTSMPIGRVSEVPLLDEQSVHHAPLNETQHDDQAKLDEGSGYSPSISGLSALASAASNTNSQLRYVSRVEQSCRAGLAPGDVLGYYSLRHEADLFAPVRLLLDSMITPTTSILILIIMSLPARRPRRPAEAPEPPP
jgi:hypothetical protein